MNESIEILLEGKESPILEFKRQWYWDAQTPDSEMADKWGELVKDIISLANGYLDNVGSHRYLIIGFSECESKTYHVDIENIKHLHNIINFKKTIIQKLEKYTSPSLVNLNIESIPINGHTLLVFEIPSPTHLTELKSTLKTKTRQIDEGGVLVRKGQNSDEIRTATPKEIECLTAEFSKYRESILYNSMNPKSADPMCERSIERTVQLFMDKNSSFSLANNYPVKDKKWKEGIIYEVYRLVDGFSGVKEFIYIHESASQSKTLEEIKRGHFVSKMEDSIVLIDRPKINNIDKRKSNIKRLFRTDYVFFVDEFGYEYLYKDCIPPYEKFNLPVYVDGLYDGQDMKDQSALNRLKVWFEAEDEPLFVVSGHGGIGKTTLAKQFLDYINDASLGTGILFIDSKEIINELSRSFSLTNKISDVFDFYKALMAIDKLDTSRFDRDLLKLSIDNGSLIVVLDGIDEVIAKLGDKFDVEKFITSISNEYSSDLHKTKVLITCRDHFWNEIGKKVALPEIILKAFNEPLAEDFFSQKLKGDQKKIRKAMLMAKDLAIESYQSSATESSRTFIPFLLDMIGYLINSQGVNVNHNDLFESRYLSTENHTDLLVGQICKREIVKLESLNLDQQIQFFILMASSRQNSISLYDIKSELLTIINDVDDSLIEKIKGHPLVQCENHSICFRYDVFDTYFKSLLVVDFFKRKDVCCLDENSARIISGYVKYDSSFTIAISEKISLDDDVVFFCVEVIEKIATIDQVNQELFVSAIVSLLLRLLQDTPGMQSNITTRTDLLVRIFGYNDQINKLCLVDIFGNANTKPTFDFSGKTLIDCAFDNYEYFWECEFDDNTRFQRSRFKDINPRDGINFKIPENLFSSSCDLTLVQHLLTKKNAEAESTRAVIMSDLVRVFKLFYQRGNFYPRKQEEVRKKLSTVSLLSDLLSKGVILNYKDPGKPTMKQYKINADFNSVIDFIEQGTPSSELQKLAYDLDR